MFAPDKGLIPKLRFPEFVDEWEECELKDIAHISKGFGISKDQLSETGKPCVLYGELYTKYKSEVITEILSKTNIEETHLVYSQRNDVIIPSSGETAIDISTARCVPFDNILLGGDLTIIRLKEQDGRFFSYQLNGVRRLDIAKIAQGVSVVHLYGDNLKRLKVSFPTIAEQNKISTFLALVDKRIETQSRAIEKLQSLMSAIVEMALCKQVLRFPPFTTSWKKTKLGELGYFIRGLSYDNNLVVDDDSQTLVVRSNNINSGKEINLDSDVVFVSKSPDDEQILRKDDIVFCMANGSSALVGKNSYYNGGYNGTITIGVFCGIYRGQSKLTRWILCSSEYQRAIFNLMQGGNGAIANLKGNDILNLSFKYPTENEEESKLVSLLSAIDTKIRNEEQLLKYYQTQKQHLLKQMFI